MHFLRYFWDLHLLCAMNPLPIPYLTWWCMRRMAQVHVVLAFKRMFITFKKCFQEVVIPPIIFNYFHIAPSINCVPWISQQFFFFLHIIGTPSTSYSSVDVGQARAGKTEILHAKKENDRQKQYTCKNGKLNRYTEKVILYEKISFVECKYLFCHVKFWPPFLRERYNFILFYIMFLQNRTNQWK